ncbi:hypothetical protein LPB136_09415 [Tenacibaculum todarodis]|uniref:Uncharacterized protein n=1 Tax=Tenacibaculum todarodis TaxID=1850252 RepID=A0A1L3JKF6_9FLAO|nr:hypothetical protein LPB136_09415 [Tenacibaculum todarodis]
MTIKEIYEGTTIFDYRSILLILLLLVLFLSVSFYNVKSHQFHNNNLEILSKKEINRIKVSTIINILIGITITVLFIGILTVYHIKDLSFSEISRTLLSLILFLYGILKMTHSIKTFKKLKAIN